MTALPMNGMTFVDDGVHTHINTPKMAPIAPTTMYIYTYCTYSSACEIDQSMYTSVKGN